MDRRPEVVSREQWLEQRARLLAEEKAFSQQREALAAKRRALPWVRVTSDYTFVGPSDERERERSLLQLFDGRGQLLVYHLMFAPENDAACRGCSFWADAFDGARIHLAQRDVTLVAISRAPLPKLRAFAERMGWHFPWYSATSSAFNIEFGVTRPDGASDWSYNYGSERTDHGDKPGISVFTRDAEGHVFHTYSCYGRGIDMVNPTYQFLDLVPKGRDEAGLPFSMSWLRHHDAY